MVKKHTGAWALLPPVALGDWGAGGRESRCAAGGRQELGPPSSKGPGPRWELSVLPICSQRPKEGKKRSSTQKSSLGDRRPPASRLLLLREEAAHPGGGQPGGEAGRIKATGA